MVYLLIIRLKFAVRRVYKYAPVWIIKSELSKINLSQTTMYRLLVFMCHCCVSVALQYPLQ